MSNQGLLQAQVAIFKARNTIEYFGKVDRKEANALVQCLGADGVNELLNATRIEDQKLIISELLDRFDLENPLKMEEPPADLSTPEQPEPIE